MKSIVFITGAMTRGGAERVISLLSNQYVQLGWQVRIVMLLHNRVEYILHPNVEVINFSDDKVNVILNIPRLILKLRYYIKRNKPNVVVSFMAPICLIAGIACYHQDTRWILSERIDPSAEKRNPLFAGMLNFLYSKCDKTVLQTKRVMNYFPENIRNNSIIIPNPIQVSTMAFRKRKKRIVTAGRLMPQKNQAMLIEAFSKLHEIHSDYVLDIYGEGPLKSILQEKINTLGLSNVVRLKGNVPDIHEQIADAEMFVLPSDFEGLSNALLEAMMMGLACISTNCAGSDEVITDGQNGIPFIPIKNAAPHKNPQDHSKGIHNNSAGANKPERMPPNAIAAWVRSAKASTRR